MNVEIRPAQASDLDAINDIYNYYVAGSPASYDLIPMTPGQRREWWHAHAGHYPVLAAVAVVDAAETPINNAVVGWASLSQYRGRPGYRYTVENSVYLRPEFQRRGLGTRLLAELLAAGRAARFHTVLAFVEASQAGSLRLHERAGFRRVGTLEQVGRKFDRWLDTVVLQLHLGAV